jgi:acetyl esterase
VTLPGSTVALDPAITALLADVKRQGFPGWAYLTVEQGRAMLAGMRPLAGAPEPVSHVEDLVIPGTPAIRARLYRPASPAPLPLLVYFHAGGWVAGDYEDIDAPVRALANRAACAVLSVNYRLAPEHKYPAAVEDAYAAVRWASENGERHGWDGQRLAVIGDSAGGTLATVTAMRARDEGGPAIRAQVLIYPVLDHDYDTASYRQFGGSGGVLTRTDMVWFHCHYLSHPEQLDLPHVSPLRAGDLRGLPEALLILPEADPLRDEGLRYAERLRDGGVSAEARVYAGMVHGFWQLGGVVPQARTALEEVAGVLRSRLHVGGVQSAPVSADAPQSPGGRERVDAPSTVA